MVRFCFVLVSLHLAGPLAAADGVVLNAGKHPGPRLRALVAADGKSLVTVGEDRFARVWDADSGKLVRELLLPAPHGDTFHEPRAWLSPDGKLLALPFCTSAEPRGKLLLVPLDDSGGFRLMGGQDFDVELAAFSPDGKRIATVARQTSVVVWDVATGEKVCEPKPAENCNVTGVAFTPDGKGLSSFQVQHGYYEKSISGAYTWDAATGKLLSTWHLHHEGLPRVEWSPDGKQLAVERGATHFFAADGKYTRATGTPYDYPFGGGFDTQGRYLAAWRRDGKFLIRDELTGKEVSRLAVGVGFVGFAADGRRAVTADLSGTYAVHDLATGKEVRRIGAAVGQPNAVGWAGGRVLAWGTGESQYGKDAPVTHSLDLGTLEGVKLDPKLVTRKRSEWDGVKLEDGGYSAAAIANGKRLHLDYVSELDSDDVKTLTLVGPGHAVLVTGAGTFGFDTKTGRRVCGYKDAGWAVAPTADGKVWATNDFYGPLIRVYRAGDGEPALTLFVDGSEWIAWTANGAWASSQGGEKLAGTASRGGVQAADVCAVREVAARPRGSDAGCAVTSFRRLRRRPSTLPHGRAGARTWRRRHGVAVVEPLAAARVQEFCHQRRPTRLVTRAQSRARVAVEVLVEQKVVPEVRVRLHLLVRPEARSPTVRAAQEQPRQPPRQLHGRLQDRDLRPAADGILDREVVAVVVVELLQALDDEEVDREPDGAAPVRVPAEHAGVGVAGDVADRERVAVRLEAVRVVAVEAGQAADAERTQKLVLVEEPAQELLHPAAAEQREQSPLAAARLEPPGHERRQVRPVVEHPPQPRRELRHVREQLRLQHLDGEQRD